MERSINKCGATASGTATVSLKKPERKITEKNRRTQMKSLYDQLFSLLPPHLISKGGDNVPDRVDKAIEYIQSLKTNLETIKTKNEKMSSSRKRPYEHTSSVNACKSVDIQIHEVGPGVDIIVVTGLKSHSNFCDIVHVLDQYSTEVVLANFSHVGHSTFHVRHKKIGAEEMCKRLKILLEGGSSSIKELGDGATSWTQVDSNSNPWDFDISCDLWEWDLGMMPMSILS